MSTIIRGNDNFDSASPIPADNFTAKAWLLMNISQFIQASGNVASVLDESTGKFKVNLAVAMEDNRFAWSGSAKDDSGNGDVFMGERSSTSRTTSTVRIGMQNSNLSLRDHNNVSITFVR